MVGAEAMMAGKPLLGVNEGFTRYQVDPGVTGKRFEPTTEGIREIIRAFDASQYDSGEIQSVAQRYSYEEFENGVNRVIEGEKN